MIASIPLLKAGYPPISIPGRLRNTYYQALEKVPYNLISAARYSPQCIIGRHRRLRPVGRMFLQWNGLYERIFRVIDEWKIRLG